MVEDKAWATWAMDLSSRAPGTRRLYLSLFKAFMERWGITSPEALFEMRMGDLKTGDPRDQKRIESMIKVQMAEMREKGYSASHCRNLWKAVKSFFEAQGLEIQIKAKDQPRGQYNGSRLALAGQIRAMYELTAWEFRQRNRAIITFLKDSGLRIGDLAALDIGDYEDAVTRHNDRGEPFLVFQSTPIRKTHTIAYVHVGPEAVKDLEKYLAERRREEGELKRRDPLFAMRKGERFTSNSLTALFLRLRDKLGKEGIKVSAHSLRKFHTTMLESVIPKNWVMKLQGKMISDSSGPYSQVEVIPDELTKAYMNGYDRIRVFGASEDEKKRDTELKALREKVKVLEEDLGFMKNVYTGVLNVYEAFLMKAFGVRTLEEAVKTQRWKEEVEKSVEAKDKQ